jgi:Fe-S-cluster containining protein
MGNHTTSVVGDSKKRLIAQLTCRPNKWEGKRKGECKRCGRCCQGKFLFQELTVFEKLVLVLFLRKKYRFLSKSFCPFLRYRGETAVCRQYPNRPDFCSRYPAVPSDVIKGCGFYFTNERE